MKKFLMLLLIAGYSHVAYTQVITISDPETGDPLELVVLTSSNNNTILMTNAMGQADITSFKDAEGIDMRLIGYKVVRKSFAELTAMNFTISLPRENISLDQIVVAASRWSQGSREVPAKITSISSREITLQNPQTAADLLGASGEVFVQKSQQGGGSPMIRGFSTNRLLYVVDGVRMNTAIFRSGNLQNVISLDPFAIESTEILFGPGSVIYGSDAIGGVMSFRTLTPQLSFNENSLITGKGIARYSSANNEFTGHFDINVGGRKWGMVSSISSSEFDDLRMGSYGPDEYLRHFYVQRQDSVDRVITNDDPLLQKPSAYSQINFMQKFLFVPNDKWDIHLGIHYSATSSYARYDRHVRYKDGLPRYGEWNYGPQKWLMNSARISHHGNNSIYDEMSVNLAFQQFEESRFDRNINDDQRHIRIEDVDAYSINVDFAKSVLEKNQLFYGAEVVIDKVRSVGIDEDISMGESMEGPARYPQATWSSYGLYANYLMKLDEKFSVQAGVRYSLFDMNAEFDTRFYPFPFTSAKINNSAITGSLGFVLTPTEKWTLSANLSTGFRSPNVDDAGKVFDSEPGFVIVPNIDLKPEYAYNAEIGLAHVIGSNVKIDVTGFYTFLDNALVRRDFTLNGMDSILYDGEISRVQAIQNGANANVYGLQFGIEAKLNSGFGFTTDINYQVGEEELSDGSTSPSRHAAPLYGVTSLRFVENDLSLILYTQYSAGKAFEDLPQEEKDKTEIYAIDDNGNPYSPAWATLNFKAMINFEKKFTITAGLENITDLRYRPYSSGIVAPGRNFILSFRLGF